ncbi:MAG: phosphoribosylanthranilate isomerase [Zetaproteobacteria bacterium]|nr:phosphoribosylanthranilate isomerase [Zetaproteobacteria bacterium]
MTLFRTRLKVCGITRQSDAMAASLMGVDALGFVFYKPSPRYVCPEKAAEIIRGLPPFVTSVGLFVNPTQSEIDDVLRIAPLHNIQLHGDESPQFCQAQSLPIIKSLAIETVNDLKHAHDYPCALLLDTKAPKGVYGGTGKAFDWDVLSHFDHDYPLLLAGGLRPDNVVEAMSKRMWFALDVSSGVESSAGIKESALISQFLMAMRQSLMSTQGVTL